MIYNFNGTKEAYRGSLEYKAQQKRKQAEILNAEAAVIENLAREIFHRLTKVESKKDK